MEIINTYFSINEVAVLGSENQQSLRWQWPVAKQRKAGGRNAYGVFQLFK